MNGENMKNKLITFNLITISLVILIITMTGNYFYQKAMTKSRLIYTTELQKQLSNSFLLKIKSVENTLEVLSKTDAIVNYLIRPERIDLSDGILTEQKVRDLFYSYGKIYPEFLSMVLISKDGNDYVSNDSYRPVDDSFKKESWFNESMEQGYSYQFYNAIRNLKSWKMYDNQTFLSIAKAVKNGDENIGVLLIDLSLQELRDFYSELELDTDNFFFLMNDDGQVVLSPANKIVHRIKSEWFTDDEGVVRANLLNRKYNLIYNKYANKKLTIVGAYDVLKEQDVLKTFFQLSLSIAMVAFALAVSWSIFFVSKVTKPLVKLSSLMKKASTGNLEVSFDENCDSEIRLLGDAFNKMVVKIKELLGLVYEEKQHNREVELQVMQEQIKPKFIYNILDTISGMAKKKENFEVVNISDLMSDFLRVYLKKGDGVVPLEEELKMVMSYLEIQRIINKGAFAYDIACPKALKAFMIPRLCLQPLVENSVNHGILGADSEEMLLRISVMDEENGVTILIEDNGSRMPSSIMRQLNYNLSHNDWDEWEGGIGIQNVGKRLWNNFGKGSGLSYYINRKGYTVAKLTILYDEQEERIN